MFISMMFAGHHTTSGTAAWTLIELLRHPDVLAGVTAELDDLYADGGEVSYQALREMPRLESAIKEALRLHPPLILLLRVAKEDLEVEGYRIRAGQAGRGRARPCPTGSPRTSPTPTPSCPSATSSPATRTGPTRGPGSPSAPAATAASGRAFAMMQLKAIFSVLLRDWEFELAQPPESYRNDHSKMVVQLAQPCVVRYRRRRHRRPSIRRSGTPVRIVVDRDLCQGHGVCESEAPDVFSVSKNRRADDPRRASRPRMLPAQVEQAVTLLPHATPSRSSRRTEDAGIPLRRAGRDGGPVAGRQPPAQEAGDWRPMADMYTEDATYGWNIGPNEEFMAVGRDEIRDIALGLEMGGLDGWTYPYQKVLIDRRQGEIIGLWKQIADADSPRRLALRDRRARGQLVPLRRRLAVVLAARLLRRGNATALFIEMIKADTLSDGMRRRIERAASGELLPGHYRLGEAPAGLWDYT